MATILKMKRPQTTRAQIIKSALEACRDERGRLKPDAIVKAARNKRNPLNKEFEWRDSVAAHTARLDRARDLITTYLVQPIIHQTRRIKCVSYARDPFAAPAEQSYISLTAPEIDRRYAEAILDNEISRCSGCIERARAVASMLGQKYADIPSKLEVLLQQLLDIKARLKAAE